MYEPQLVYEGKHICPVCKKETLMIREYIYDAPKVGKLLLSVWECENCGFRVRDVKPLETLSPIKIELKVENEDDLKIFLYRSAYANIIIPELGVEISAGSAYQGVLTTVEGLLEILIDNIDECDEQKCDKIFKAKEGKIPFTLIIEDPSGLSFVQSEKAVVKKIEEIIQS